MLGAAEHLRPRRGRRQDQDLLQDAGTEVLAEGCLQLGMVIEARP